MPLDPDQVISQTRAWVQHAVIGLNLCPFAKAVQAKDRIRYVCCEASTPSQLLDTLRAELGLLSIADPEVVETTLLMHPAVLTDFDDYNDFLGEAEAALADMGLEGQLQLASFHPQYRFAGTHADDLSNATNRSPYPCLHLLRESSITQAVAAFPEPEAIYETNLHTLEQLGQAGWTRLQDRWTHGASNPAVDAPSPPPAPRRRG